MANACRLRDDLWLASDGVRRFMGVTMAPLVISLERLHHFQCPSCKGWWSIGDAPQRAHWFCPWCGARHETLPAEKKISTE